jgi:hypothetical protein
MTIVLIKSSWLDLNPVSSFNSRDDIDSLGVRVSGVWLF